MTTLAIYDMDKTITRAPTWTPFLLAAARELAPWRLALLPLAGVATLGYALRLLDRAALKQATHRLLLGSPRVTDLDRVAERFADRIVADGVFDSARAQIAADRAAGSRLVMATASYAAYAGAIAARLGFDAVIGTQVVVEHGRALPRIAGENCYGAAKLRMIEAWLAEQGIARADVQVRFYSDHVSDAPALGWADAGFAVNAHPPLRALAAERGWTSLDWTR